jgi:hypothetical protein
MGPASTNQKGNQNMEDIAIVSGYEHAAIVSGYEHAAIVSGYEHVAIVSGYKRSGTSLMMRCLKEMGKAVHFDSKFESYLMNEYEAENPYFFEDKRMVHDGFQV